MRKINFLSRQLKGTEGLLEPLGGIWSMIKVVIGIDDHNLIDQQRSNTIATLFSGCVNYLRLGVCR